MNGHAQDWIAAYYDDALSPADRLQAERHLAGCEPCRQLLEQQRRLTSLLQEAPPAPLLKSERRFVSEIALQLDRRLDRPAAQASRAWLILPALLLVAWGFIETYVVVDTLVGFFPGFGQGLLGLMDRLAAPLALVAGSGQVLAWLGAFDFLDWNRWTALLVLLVLGMLYAGWLAAWWSHHRASLD
jgi:anti-sigma factor RsiW